MSKTWRFLIFAALLAGCQQAAPFDPAAEGRALLARDAEWAGLASDGRDVDRVVSYWSDDAQVIEPGEPIYRGKAAIRQFVAASFATPGFHIHWVSHDPVFSPDGKLAYLPADDETRLPDGHGGLTTLHSRGISIWRREADGVWRCVVDIANEAPSHS